jgi:hypothetical protein
MENWQYLLMILGAIALIVVIYFLVKKGVEEIIKVRHRDLFKKGLTEMPAVPYSLLETAETLLGLLKRGEEIKDAKDGLDNEFTINGETQTGYMFMFGTADNDPSKEEKEKLLKKIEQLDGKEFSNHDDLNSHLEIDSLFTSDDNEHKYTKYFLDDPEQYKMAWTNYHGLYDRALPKAKEYASIITDPDAASEHFWSMIAENGFAYNLLFLQMVKEKDISEIKEHFKHEWDDLLQPVYAEEALYAIDLRIFSAWGAEKVNGFDRWTPGAWIMLKQDKTTKKLLPIAIRIESPTDYEIYTRENVKESSTWIYALSAARTAVTVYGIWLGHVYHWHVVTASMQMTMFNTFNKEHAIRKLLDPQSKSLIGFNDALFRLWSHIGPPTSFTSTEMFLELTNKFATNRSFFDDDPNVAIKKLGLDPKKFTIKDEWDQYPVVQYLLHFWEITGKFAESFVYNTYKSEDALSKDSLVKDWIAASSDPKQGNIRGLNPSKDLDRKQLKKILHSLIYRVAAHGNSRQLESLNPALCFVANYPPCLQKAKMLKPDADQLDTKELLSYLPNTGTIGSMMGFYFIFTYSKPYNPLIPLSGEDTDLYFDNPNDPRNIALIQFRNDVAKFVRKYQTVDPLIHQWPASIET